MGGPSRPRSREKIYNELEHLLSIVTFDCDNIEDNIPTI